MHAMAERTSVDILSLIQRISECPFLIRIRGRV